MRMGPCQTLKEGHTRCNSVIVVGFIKFRYILLDADPLLKLFPEQVGLVQEKDLSSP